MISILGELVTDLALYQMYAAAFVGYVFGETLHVPGLFFCLAAAFLLTVPEMFPGLRESRKRIVFVIGAGIVLAAEFCTGATPVQMGAYVPAAAYLIAMGILREWHAEYDRQKVFFGKSFLGLIVIPVTVMFGLERAYRTVEAVLPWCMFYLICGFAQLRILRQAENGGGNRKNVLWQLAELAFLFLVCFLLEITGAFGLFLEGLRALWTEAVRPLLQITLDASLYLIVVLLGALITWLQNLKEKSSTDGTAVAHAIEDEMRKDLGYQMEQWQPISDSTVTAWTVLLIAAGAGILIFAFQWIRKSRFSEPAEDGTEESRETLREDQKKRKRIRIPRDPRAAICECFARYIRILEKKGADPKESDTSRMLTDKGKAVLPELEPEMEELRSRYLPARYRRKTECTDNERSETLRLWKTISRQSKSSEKS